MKLVVERTGGFIGLRRRGERDVEDLSREQRAALDKVFELERASPEHLTAQDPGADRFTYRLEVHGEKGTKSIILPESRMPKELEGIVTQ